MAPSERLLSVLGNDWKMTPIQRVSFKSIHEGKSCLLVSQTGSGKTEAALLPLIERLLDKGWGATSVLYISPLRALNRDLGERLGTICEGLGLKSDVRHGDTIQSQRQRQTKNPPDILVITPETLQSLFMGKHVRAMISAVHAIIIDEIHDVAASERGAQLMVGISRLEELCGRSLQRIGLSATIPHPKSIAAWMHVDTEIIQVPSTRSTNITVRWTKKPSPEEVHEATSHNVSGEGYMAIKSLGQMIRDTSPALVFCNSRSEVEVLGQRIERIEPDLIIRVHHGSLDKEVREEVELELSQGTIDALICTSSLELGIDVGPIRQVIQMRSPRQSGRLLQRIGRSEHTLEGVAQGQILVWDDNDLLEAAVLARRALAQILEIEEPRKCPELVAVNQILHMLRVTSPLPVTRILSVLRGAPTFGSIKTENMIQLLRQMNEQRLLIHFEDPELSDQTPWITEDTNEEVGRDSTIPELWKQGWVEVTGRGKVAVIEGVTMIPKAKRYVVRDLVSRRPLGTIDEAFIMDIDDAEERPRFLFAGRPWTLVEADPDTEEALVAPDAGLADAPVWVGEMIPVNVGPAIEMGAVRRAIVNEFSSNIMEGCGSMEPEDERGSLQIWNDLPLGEIERSRLIEDVIEHLDTAGVVPDDRTLTVEERRDGITVHCCRGTAANHTLGLLLQALASTREGRLGRLSVDTLRIQLAVPGIKASDIVEWLSDIPAAAVRPMVETVLPHSLSMKLRFVEVARSFWMLRTVKDPRRINIAGLMRELRGTPLQREAVAKTLHERFDIETVEDLLIDIQSGKIGVHITPPGHLGASRAERDMRMPEYTSAEVLERLENRLLQERYVLICINCQHESRGRVALLDEGPLVCASCGGRMLACAPEIGRERLKTAVQDPEAFEKVSKCAEIVGRHRKRGVLTLMARGVGPDTCQRILRAVEGGTMTDLMEGIRRAEIEYARNRRFWG